MSYSEGSLSTTVTTTTSTAAAAAISTGTTPVTAPFLARQTAQAALPPGVPNNYVHKNITGDGNCLFRAVAVALGLSEDEHLLIRDSAFGYATEHPEIIQNVIGNIPGYLMRLANPGEWAGDEELSLLALALGVNFQIYHANDGNTLHINSPIGGPTIYLEYRPGHYNVYAPAAPTVNVDILSTFFKSSSELSPAHIKKAVKLYENLYGKPKFYDSMQAAFEKAKLDDFKLLEPALQILIANYPEEGENAAQFLLVAQIASALLGINVLEHLRTYTNSEYPPVAAGAGAGSGTSVSEDLRRTFIDSYVHNLMPLMDPDGAEKLVVSLSDAKGAKKLNVFNTALLPVDLKLFLVMRLMNMLEIYTKSYQMDAKKLGEIFPGQLKTAGEPSFSQLFGLQAEVRVRLLNEIKSILMTYRIEEYQTFLRAKAKNDTIGESDCKALAKSILAVIDKHKAQGIIIPLSSQDHQIYLYANTDGTYHLVIHNYGVRAIEDMDLIKPLHFIVDAAHANEVIIRYLVRVFEKMVDPTIEKFEHLNEDIIHCAGALSVEDKFRKKPQGYENCVAYGYNNTQFYANIRYGEIWSEWLLAQEFDLLVERTFEARFHWPSTGMIDPTLRSLLSNSDKKPISTTDNALTRGG